jgi:hypothetical protein
MSRATISLALIAGLAFATAAGHAQAADKKTPPKTAPAPKPEAKPAPSFDQVHEGMSDSEVRSVLGEPTSREEYITGKNFIPFYHGPDRSRSNWVYHGKGNIVFTRNSYSGTLSVIEVHKDPSQ